MCLLKRIEAHERVAHGVECDCCESLTPVRGPTSMPEGYYVVLERVTEAGNRLSSDQLFFCSKECLIDAMKWHTSALYSKNPRGKAPS